jgi:hypothetical protein
MDSPEDLRRYGIFILYVGVSSKQIDCNVAPWLQHNTYGWHASDGKLKWFEGGEEKTREYGVPPGANK